MLTTSEELPLLLSVEDFDSMTGSRYADATYALEAASAAIRDWCGWHIYPSVECTFTCSPYDRITGTRSRFINLPSMLVTDISSVTEDGAELSSGKWEGWDDGLLKRCGFAFWGDSVEVVFTSGYSSVPASLAQAVACVAETVLQSLPDGVASETAGNVSISYKTDASSAANLAVQRMAGAFSKYRLVSAHAS